MLSSLYSDIKLDNILLDCNWIAKMTDFGFAKKIADSSRGEVTMSTTFCGTLPYECPQILEHKAYNGFKADIWSMVSIALRLPFPQFTNHFTLLLPSRACPSSSCCTTVSRSTIGTGR